MRPLTAHEKRTVRIAGIGIGVYLALFCGLKAFGWLDTKHAEYQKLLAEAKALKEGLKPYETKILIDSKLMTEFRMDPATLEKKSLVAEASAAIQKAATSGGIQLGTVRESVSGASSKDLGSMQLEAIGPVPAMMTFLQKFETLGYPLIIDSIQISPEPKRPGAVKLNATIMILDFEQWKNEGAPHA